MSKPVTPQEMFDLWQKMVNPGAYPLQSLMFPVLDPKELDKKIGELEVVEHWLRANLNMLQLSIKSLEYQRALLEGGEKARAQAATPSAGGASPGELPNPAMWAWNMMAQAGKQATDAAQEMMAQAGKQASDAAPETRQPAPTKSRRRRKPGSS